jgi:Kef-type K+ transport system membrane component KefB
MRNFEVQPLAALGILFMCGYFGGRFANRLKLPRVSGYIIIGILLSPSLTGILPRELVEERFSIITDIALAVIAYFVGGSLNLSKIRLLGKNIFWINLTQALGAFFLTILLIAILSPHIVKLNTHASFLQIYLPLALILGAVAVATDPATVLAIVHEYKAKGPLTTTLLGVVALDDGMAIILYAFASTMAGALAKMEAISFYRMAAEPIMIILGSIILGTVFGLLLTGLASWIRWKESLLVVILGVILLCTGIASQMDLSPLLANMMVGFLIVNMAKHSHDLFVTLENIEEPIFALFFALAGTHFDLTVIKVAGFLAVVIAFGRFGGKLIGTKLGADLSDAPVVVKKYLGYWSHFRGQAPYESPSL